MRCPHPVTLGSAMRVTWREQFSQFLFNHQCLLKTSLASVAQENNVSIKPNLSEGKFVITARSVHIQDVAEEVTCMWRRPFHVSPRHLCYTAPAERWNKVLSRQFFFLKARHHVLFSPSVLPLNVAGAVIFKLNSDRRWKSSSWLPVDRSLLQESMNGFDRSRLIETVWHPDRGRMRKKKITHHTCILWKRPWLKGDGGGIMGWPCRQKNNT